ncbi:sphingomyelin phosphodiesterase 4-like isoform X2 [Anneissia japonica]|uniref:sphingomyelin phosphodiesterase 4-like isoform X2 n=1 Tax=Anneissia japonica TaxID=1529436 RepID=UPI00142561D3|nr:sphingomyelin phosphodiesterase 4-like isoform X2 [Anneissia japonica]
MSSSPFVNSQQNRDRFSPFLERINRLPTLAVRERCQDLQSIFNQYNYKELKPIFPKIVEHIFSHIEPYGWGLNNLQDTTSRYNPWHDVRLRSSKDGMLSDFKIVRDFFSPSGPLFDLIYKLQADPAVRFEFSTEYLPAPTKDSMKQGAVPQFYMTKLSYLAPNCLQLSAFDFYMFHFAYFIISMQSLQQQPLCNLENSVYTCLVEDYLNFFLPLGGRRVPPAPYTGASPGYSQSGSVTQTRPIHGGVLWCYLQSSRQQNQTSFLRQTHNTTLHRSASICQSDSHLESIGQQENWRSEVMVQVLAEFWLNQNSLFYDQKSFTQQVRANVLPSQDLVRLVRMLIKHLHFFANSAKEVVPSPYHQPEEPLEEFKRCVIPLIVQKKLYSFFRHGFDRWPLDSSFRLMLETWLSFIQPWRYLEQQQHTFTEDKDQPLTNRCKKFVAENLHFYTILYQEYVQRALRQDLAAPKNAQMLYRVGKVFGQADLHSVIEDAEVKATDYNGVLMDRMSNTQVAASGSFLTLTTSSSSVSVLQQVAEIEGPNFRYKPLFGIESRQMMEQLFKCMSQAKATLQSNENQNNKHKTGFFAWLSGLMMDDDFGNDRAKVESYLEYSKSFFAKIFQIEDMKDYSTMAWSTPSRGSDQQAPDMSAGELTPLGRYQLANGLRRCNVTYGGNPDLQPIRTYENKHLVRLLNRVCTHLNQVFGEEIKYLCIRDGFLGTIAYQYFQPPYRQSTQLNETLQPDNNPRICLRFLASYRTILYLLIFFAFLYWMDFSLFGAVFVLFVILVLYGLIGACFQKMTKQRSHVD